LQGIIAYGIVMGLQISLQDKVELSPCKAS